MQAIEQTHNWGNFSGGEGDGFYLGPRSSYRLGRNIDTRQLENGVKICSKLVDTEITYDGDINEVNPFASNSFSTDTGKIYESGTLKLTLSSGISSHNNIIGFGRLTKLSDSTLYTYGFSKTSSGVGKVFRFATDFSSATDIGTFTLAQGRTANANYMPVLSLPDRMLFGYGNTIFQVDNNEIISEVISFPKNSELVAITYYQDTYKIYYNIPKYSLGPDDGYVNNWDGTSITVSQFIRYENSGIINVVNDGAYDFVVFGNTYSNDLYRVGGLNRTEIRVNTEESNNNTRLLGTEGAMREGILYLNGINKLGERCLYSYGSYYPGFANSLVPENVVSFINKMYADIQNMYIYDNDAGGSNIGKIYTKSFLYDSNTESSATIYNYAITGSFGGYTEKSIKHIYVGYNLINSNNSINVYVKTSGGPTASNAGGRTLIKTITDINKRGVKIGASELSPISIGNWYQLEYKVELITPGTNGPILHLVKTVYLDNING